MGEEPARTISSIGHSYWYPGCEEEDIAPGNINKFLFFSFSFSFKHMNIRVHRNFTQDPGTGA
jgi:hypothetical protein